MCNQNTIKLLTKVCIEHRLSNNDQDDSCDKETIENMINEFKEIMPYDYDINNLKLIYTSPNNDTSVYSLGDKIVGAHNCDEWFNVPYINLSNEHPSNEEHFIKLLNKSSDNICYDLYPFEQCGEVPLEALGINVQNLKVIDEGSVPKCLKDYEVEMSFEYGDGFTISIAESNYYISKNNEIISGFSDPETHFQLGDGCTNCYLADTGELIIENCGDVSSTVIVKTKI